MTSVSPYPLHWPSGVDRTPSHKRTDSRFQNATIAKARNALAVQVRQLGARGLLVSSNVPLLKSGEMTSIRGHMPDPGVAVYFSRKETPYQFASDRWLEVADNLWAIQKHVEALRGQERWGVGSLEQAFSGYAALPPPGGASAIVVSRSWWEVMGVFPSAEMAVVEAAYRALAKSRHPDVGGTTEAFQELQDAFEQARRERE